MSGERTSLKPSRGDSGNPFWKASTLQCHRSPWATSSTSTISFWIPPPPILVVTSDKSEVGREFQSDKWHQACGEWTEEMRGTHQPPGIVGGQGVAHSPPRDMGDWSAVRHGQCHRCAPTEKGHYPLRCSPDAAEEIFSLALRRALSALHQGSKEWLGRCSLLVHRNVSGVTPALSSFPLPEAPVWS